MWVVVVATPPVQPSTMVHRGVASTCHLMVMRVGNANQHDHQMTCINSISQRTDAIDARWYISYADEPTRTQMLSAALHPRASLLLGYTLYI